MIQYTRQSIFESPARAICNPVNTVGVSGKGLALAFAKRYPASQGAYVRACRNGTLRTGTVLVVAESEPVIVYFPTKQHWRNPSTMEWIEAGLEDLAMKMEEMELESVAVPKLGCGLGGLDWKEVHEKMRGCLAPRGFDTWIHQ